jgi:hypothetical protein
MIMMMAIGAVVKCAVTPYSTRRKDLVLHSSVPSDQRHGRYPTVMAPSSLIYYAGMTWCCIQACRTVSGRTCRWRRAPRRRPLTPPRSGRCIESPQSHTHGESATVHTHCISTCISHVEFPLFILDRKEATVYQHKVHASGDHQDDRWRIRSP